MNNLIADAIKNRQVLRLQYDGLTRLVEPTRSACREKEKKVFVATKLAVGTGSLVTFGIS